MTEKKSQIVIPINANSLFTSLATTSVIALLAYIWITIPNQIKELKEKDVNEIKQSVYRIESESINTTRRIEDMIKMIKQNSKSVRDMEKNRFTEKNALTLEKKIINEVKIEISPFIKDIYILKNDYNNLQSNVKQLHYKINELRHPNVRK